MASQFDLFVCEKCGNVVELLHGTHDGVVCCGQPMKLEHEKTEGSAAKEKHAPVIEATDTGCKVIVGSVPHPMEKEHWIQFVEIITKDGHRCKKFLEPGEKPEASFHVKKEDVLYAREYCNLHGLWRS